MASKLLRRSGIAVGMVMDQIGFDPDVMFQVGVGCHHEEVKVIQNEWPHCHFIGAEPCPGVDEALKDYPGRVDRVAMSVFEGEAQLFRKGNHKDGSSLCKPINQKADVVLVKKTTMDIAWLLDASKYDNILLWLDCEGHEYAVIAGGTQFMRYVDVVNVELTSNPPAEGWCDPNEVHQELVDKGFWFQWQHTNRFVAGQRDAIYVRENLFDYDRCCCPHERRRWKQLTRS